MVPWSPGRWRRLDHWGSANERCLATERGPLRTNINNIGNVKPRILVIHSIPRLIPTAVRDFAGRFVAPKP